MPRPIIIDTDPGTDDAVAILLALAAPELEVLSLLAVAGNLPLAMTERNARAILELAGRPDIPVYAGCPRPMSLGVITAEHAHGESGLGGLAVAGRGIAGQLEPRTFTAAQRQRIMAWEVARRWRQLPAGRIFPANGLFPTNSPVVMAHECTEREI